MKKSHLCWSRFWHCFKKDNLETDPEKDGGRLLKCLKQEVILMCVWEGSTGIWCIREGDEELGLKSPERKQLQSSWWEEMKVEAKETYCWNGNRKRGRHWRCKREKATLRNVCGFWAINVQVVLEEYRGVRLVFKNVWDRVMLLWVYCQFCSPRYKLIYIKWYYLKHELLLNNSLFIVIVC